MNRIALLGCGGFIGSHCLDLFLQNPEWSVEGWDWHHDKITGHLPHPRFFFHEGNIYEDRDLADRISRCDAVISLAAICNPSQYNTRALDVIESNFIHARTIADICAERSKWLIQFSTSEVYGQTLAHWAGSGQEKASLYEMEEDGSPMLLGPISSHRWSYACAKQLLERYVYALHLEKGLAYTLIRPFNFLGPRMDFLPSDKEEALPRVLACFSAALLKREPLQLVDGGVNRRTFLAIEEAVVALKLMLDNPSRAQNQIFNLGNPANEVTIRQLAEIMREVAYEITGDGTYRSLPLQTVSSLDFYGPGYADSDRRMPNIRKAKDLLDWHPRLSLREILKGTLEPLFAAANSRRQGIAK